MSRRNRYRPTCTADVRGSRDGVLRVSLTGKTRKTLLLNDKRFIYLSIYLFIYLLIYLFISLAIYLFIYFTIHLFIYLSVFIYFFRFRHDDRTFTIYFVDLTVVSFSSLVSSVVAKRWQAGTRTSRVFASIKPPQPPRPPPPWVFSANRSSCYQLSTYQRVRKWYTKPGVNNVRYWRERSLSTLRWAFDTSHRRARWKPGSSLVSFFLRKLW